MKILKIFLWIILAMLILVVIVGAFLPRRATVSRSLLFHCPRDQVFEQVNTTRNWENWSPWHQIDSAMLIKYSGIEKGNNAGFSWNSSNKNVGNGKIEIASSLPYDSIILDMDFMENGNAQEKFVFSETDSGTLVTWSMTSDLGKNPINRYFGLLMDKFVGPDFEKGLDNMRKFINSLPSSHINFNISETEIPARITLTIRDTCTQHSISAKLSKIYGVVFHVIQTRKLQITGYPFAIYHTCTTDIFDLEAGVPIEKAINPSIGNVIVAERPQTHSVMAKYFGPYNRTSQVYAEIEKYITSKKLTVTGPFIEEYITDPQTEPDTAKWQTNIYFPVK
jgi:effector-binding domain-containing protein